MDPPFETLAGLFGVQYLTDVQGMKPSSAADAMSFLVIISGVTAFAYGWLCARLASFGGRQATLVGSAAAGLAGSLLLAVGPDVFGRSVSMPRYTIYLALFLIGQATGGMSSVWTLIPTSTLCCAAGEDEARVGLVSGIVNTVCIFADALIQMFFGMILDVYWTGSFNEDGTRHYDATSFFPAMCLLASCFAVALLSSLLLRSSGFSAPAS
jgi:MFS family permease